MQDDPYFQFYLMGRAAGLDVSDEDDGIELDDVIAAASEARAGDIGTRIREACMAAAKTWVDQMNGPPALKVTVLKNARDALAGAGGDKGKAWTLYLQGHADELASQLESDCIQFLLEDEDGEEDEDDEDPDEDDDAEEDDGEGEAA